MSFLKRFWQTFTGRAYLAGRDLEGNRFFEYPSTTADPRRTRRVVKYRDAGGDLYQYASGGRNLPVQWMMWLTHSRQQAPTTDELRADIARKQRVQANVAMIAERERQNQAGITAGSSERSQHHHSHPHDSPQAEPAHPESSHPSPSNPWQKAKEQSSDEPEAWSPRAIRRGHA
ncbi:hypothetical protein JAAARDRAFT_34217 [Jaapia argillacea MUCL 33604]|uniref:NADH dehydrogenase [ubiquinone] 1 alpha subcomplex subunit n=1 Tax=Jaapia argillacea MUCL 33604 TaxID=933084 RepID=A0A067Q4M8_9AGAM|nr:hypothetical protein JAAARDRAFT_34217 [Jaapia argillacea MUCL 33604]